MLVVIDDGWAAGRKWPARLAALEDLVDLADREGRLVVLMTTAPAADGAPFQHSGLMTPDEAAGRVLDLSPPALANRQAGGGGGTRRSRVRRTCLLAGGQYRRPR